MIKDNKFTSKIPMRFDYEQVLPGPIVSNWEEALIEIKKFQNNDRYIKKRKNISKRFNYFNDSQNSKRVFQKLKI